jgi:hypothetical protein
MDALAGDVRRLVREQFEYRELLVALELETHRRA